MRLRKNDRVKIFKKYSNFPWYSEKLYYIIEIKKDIATLNENLNGSDNNPYSDKINLKLLYNVNKYRKEKLLKINKIKNEN